MSWQESADKQVESKADQSTSSEQITSENNTFLEAKEEDSELIAQEKGSEEQDQAELSTEPEAEAEVNDEEISQKTVASESSPTAVYEEDLAGKEVLTYAIPDQAAQNIVPVSVLVDENPARTKFELFSVRFCFIAVRASFIELSCSLSGTRNGVESAPFGYKK